MRAILILLLMLSGRGVSAETLWGKPVPMGAGFARTFIEREQDQILRVGIAVDDQALTALPDYTNEEYYLPFALQVPPYDHVGINWQPSGHAPTEMRERHFDFHFYTVTAEQRFAISCKRPDAPGCSVMPEPDLVPPNHFGTRIVPRMGAHYYDKTNDAFCGGAFLATFVYGYFSGEMTFIEPMITLDTLKSKERFVSLIQQPKKVDKNGLYPLSYAIDWDETKQIHRVILQDFIAR